MDLPLEECDYFVRYMKLPDGIYAFVHLNSDATYTIVLDPRRDFDHRLDDYIHELWHIVHDDFYNGEPVYVVENR